MTPEKDTFGRALAAIIVAGWLVLFFYLMVWASRGLS